MCPSTIFCAPENSQDWQTSEKGIIVAARLSPRPVCKTPVLRFFPLLCRPGAVPLILSGDRCKEGHRERMVIQSLQHLIDDIRVNLSPN